ncbi:MAG: carbohydrate kinase family protein [Clostridia bacterium]|nr:carbohydrate kinase family protein [Clostridia bacterium]
MKKRILLIGGVSTELSMHVDALADEGGEVCTPVAYTLTPGGAAALGAVAISRLGGEAILCSAVGDDTYGKELVHFFDDLGMDTRFVKTVKGEKTAVDLFAEDDTSRRVYKSTSMLSAIDAELVEDAFTTLPDAVYISMDVPAMAVIRAAELAREKKVPSFFDGQRIPDDFPLDQLGVIDLIALPPEKTEHFTGIRPRNAQSNLEAAVELHKTLRSKTYLFKFGVGGAFAYKGNFSYYIPYVEDADERYTDLLVPAMIVETLRSGKNVRGARYASTVIALAARKDGAPILSVPSETEVLRYVLENEIEF